MALLKAKRLNSKILAPTLFLSFFWTASSFGSQGLSVGDTKISVDGVKYINRTYLDEDSGLLFDKVIDSRGKVVEGGLTGLKTDKGQARIITEELEKMVLENHEDTVFDVEISLASPQLEIPENSRGVFKVMPDGEVKTYKNGQELKGEFVKSTLEKNRISRKEIALLAYEEKLKSRASRLIATSDIELTAAISEQIESGAAHLAVKMSGKSILRLKHLPKDIISVVDVYRPAVDEIDDAMLSSKVDPFALYYGSAAGTGIGIYMTEGKCSDPGFVSNYTRLSGSRGDHTENVLGILRAVSPNSYIYCKAQSFFSKYPTSSNMAGSSGNPAVEVLTGSFYYSNSSTAYLSTDRGWDNVAYNFDRPFFKSAGNEGQSTGYVTTPGKGYNTITVGNYDDSNDTIAPGSSSVDPETAANKPDLSAPGTTITAGGWEKSGTSMAAPHAAAFTADLMSNNSFLLRRPHLVKALLLSTSRKPIAGAPDPDYPRDKIGFGGLDYDMARQPTWMGYWEGTNSYFDYAAANDYGSNSSLIEVPFYMSTAMSKVHITLSWLNRGDYTYDHRTDTFPLGMDFDITITDPNGRVRASTYNRYDPYESIIFYPAMNGTHHINIQRIYNRDTSSKFYTGLVINPFY